MTRNKAEIAIIIIVLVGVAIGALSLMRPSTVPGDAPARHFSSERAVRHVDVIAQAPHPPGSEEIERVRGYIIDQLQTMGLKTSLLDEEIAIQTGSGAIASRIQNIVAVMPGTSEGKAILLDAHYDTRAMTPGASDCSSCVASVLEIARALQEGPGLERDVILLFTDNEEYGGGLGAASFVESFPALDTIGLVLNFEGLGSGGPSFLSQTRPGSGQALGAWARSSHLPTGQSWFHEIYGRTPISTDLDRFADRGIPGMNFGYWSGGTVYHAMLDTPDRLHPRSVQQQGSNALALVREFGSDISDDGANPTDMVYFGLLPRLMVRYSESIALPIAALFLVALVIMAWVGIQRGQLSVRGGLAGMGGFVLSLLVSAALATGIWMGVNQLHGEYQAMLTFRGMFYNGGYCVGAFAALALAVSSAILILWRRKVSVLDQTLGVLMVYLLFALAISALAPGFSYLLAWPALGGVLSLACQVAMEKRNGSDPRQAVVSAIGALPGLVLITPGLYLMYQFALAPMIGILALMVSLLLGLLIGPLDLMASERPWRLLVGASALCVILLAVGSLTAGFTPGRPRPNAVAYLLDADSGQASWFSAGNQSDAWADQFFAPAAKPGVVGELYPITRSDGFPVRVGQAPVLGLDPPEIEVLSDTSIDGERRLNVLVQSMRGAPVVVVDVVPYDAVRAATVGGQRMQSRPGERTLWSLTYYATPKEGIEVEFALDPNREVVVQLSDQTWPLTAEGWSALGVDVAPRSVDMMPMPNFDYGTVVARTLRLQ